MVIIITDDRELRSIIERNSVNFSTFSLFLSLYLSILSIHRSTPTHETGQQFTHTLLEPGSSEAGPFDDDGPPMSPRIVMPLSPAVESKWKDMDVWF